MADDKIGKLEAKLEAEIERIEGILLRTKEFSEAIKSLIGLSIDTYRDSMRNKEDIKGINAVLKRYIKPKDQMTKELIDSQLIQRLPNSAIDEIQAYVQHRKRKSTRKSRPKKRTRR
jgi:seryl-tRNA synthetase